MKTLHDFITEALAKNPNRNYVKLAQTPKHAKMCSHLSRGLKGISDELANNSTYKKENGKLSLSNKVHRKLLFDAVLDRMGFQSSKEARQLFREYDVWSAEDFANWLIVNSAYLESNSYNLKHIKDFDETERERQYKAWKASDKYIPGKIYDKDDTEEYDKDADTRKMLVYDVNDPGNKETTLQFPLVGKVNKQNSSTITNFKMEWHELTGLRFFDARPILEENYIKMGKDQLQKVEYIENDDF